MKQLRWEAQARADLANIVRHFADKDPRAAALLLPRIDAAARGLSEIDTGRPGRMPGLREKSVPHTRYILAYQIDETEVIVLRVIHSAQNWTSSDWPES